MTYRWKRGTGQLRGNGPLASCDPRPGLWSMPPGCQRNRGRSPSPAESQTRCRYARVRDGPRCRTAFPPASDSELPVVQCMSPSRFPLPLPCSAPCARPVRRSLPPECADWARSSARPSACGKQVCTPSSILWRTPPFFLSPRLVPRPAPHVFLCLHPGISL